MSARRFLWRWSLRTLRRQWRQHTIIFGVICCAAMLSIAGVLATIHLVEPSESGFGKANVIATFGGDVSAVEVALSQRGIPFGVIESVEIASPGSTRRLSIRLQEPANAVTGPLVSLLDGTWPATATEIAVTDGVGVDGLSVGDTVQLEGQEFTVVGTVENPTNLADEFVMAHDLTAFMPEDLGPEKRYFIDYPGGDEPSFPTAAGSVSIITRGGPTDRTVFAIMVNVVSAFAMLEVALLTGAGFAIIAQRRSRQFGLLAAAGATGRNLRSAAAATGTIVGLLAACVGAVGAIAITGLLVPTMEETVGHRIGFSIPWWAVLPNVGLTALVAMLAARWPAQALSKAPVTHLLAALRPTPAPAGRAAVAGVILTVLGAAALALGFDRLDMTLAVVGVLLGPVGLLLLAPLLVRLIGRVARALPLTPRMAGRAIARQSRRSAAMVAALAVALSIPTGLAVVTESIDGREAEIGANLQPTALIAWLPGAEARTTAIPANLDPKAAAATIEAITEAEPSLSFVPIEMAVPNNPNTFVEDDLGAAGSVEVVEPILSGRPGTEGCFDCDTYGFGQNDANGNEIVWVAGDAWIATRGLLEALRSNSGANPGQILDLDPAALDARQTDTGQTDLMAIAADSDQTVLSTNGPLADHRIEAVSNWPSGARIPSLLLWPKFVDAQGFTRVIVGWLGTSQTPVSEPTRAAVLDAVGNDLVIEFSERPEPQTGLRSAGLVIGLVVAAGIALSAVALFVAELEDDLKILRAIGATPSTVRRLAACIAAILAGAGAAIGVLIGYLSLVPLLAANDAGFRFAVPWMALASLLLLFPMLAAAASLLASHRLSLLHSRI